MGPSRRAEFSRFRWALSARIRAVGANSMVALLEDRCTGKLRYTGTLTEAGFTGQLVVVLNVCDVRHGGARQRGSQTE